jgi:hypothetical protein
MEIVKPITLLVVSIIVTGTLAVGLLIDAVSPRATAAQLSLAPADKCSSAVHPVVYTLEFIEGKC